MDPEHRPAHAPPVRDIRSADRVKSRTKVRDELQKGALDIGDVSVAIRGEPVPIVVPLQVAQKGEKAWSEVARHDDQMLVVRR
jgi:hypothetical protein